MGSWIRYQWRPLPAAGSLGSIRFLRFFHQNKKKKKKGWIYHAQKNETGRTKVLCSVLCGWGGGWEVRKKMRHRVTG